MTTPDLTTRLADKLREALEFFNDAPRFSLRRDRKRDSYQMAAEIDRLLRESFDGPPPAAKPARMSDAPYYTPHQMEAALCAWEWVIDHAGAAEPRFPVVQELLDGIGFSAVRHCSMQAGCIALQVYEHMEARGYEFTGAYDWEFVPAVLAILDWQKLADDNQFHGEPYQPNPQDLFAVIYAADRCSRAPGTRLFSHKDEDG